MPKSDIIGFLPHDVVYREGDRCWIPLHIMRDILAILKTSIPYPEYLVSLLLDGMYNKERRTRK